MAALLLSRDHVYLLDEPTNDLHLAGLDRLEEFIIGVHAGPGHRGQPRPAAPA